MAGCMTILQVWIYDHFPVLERHSLVGGYEECNPRASLYVPIQPERTLEFDLVDLREKLDDLTEEKVTWDPYKSIRDGSIHQVAHYTGPLKCFDVVEWHNPNRVLRQFGVIQDKPKGVFLDKEKTVSKPSSFKSYYGILVLPGKRESHISHSSDKTRNKQMPVFQLENFMEFPSYLVDEKSILLDFQTEREPKSHMMSQILFCIHVISGKRVNDISRSPHRTRNKIFTFLCF
ncbi:uncharacterized protein LOC113278435 isoform X1 [Papaver somniferum]|nr:uncharacterized protein LOC113278435 isoform X1 [Papaver somniferum]